MTLRQEGVIARLVQRVAAASALEGALLIGSFAAGTADDVSDVDVIVVVCEGQFDEAWNARQQIEGGEALAAWDGVDPKHAEIGGHKWLTRELVLVECLLATASSGVRLAEPFRVMAGDDALPGRLTRRPPIARVDLEAFARDLEAAGRVHDVERAYHALAEAVRAGRGS